MQQAAYHAMAQGMDEVNGADFLASLFFEADAEAVDFLHQQGISRRDVVNFLAGSKGGEDPR